MATNQRLRSQSETGIEADGGDGIEAVYPEPKLSAPGEGHKIYPYLLGGVEVKRINQVWSTDITYIRMAQGFVYLVAVMDWFSRYVLSWSLSVTMEIDFCIEALKRALRRGRPEIFNSDQGSQFTREKFTRELQSREIAISMDGRRRCMDNIFIERLWHMQATERKTNLVILNSLRLLTEYELVEMGLAASVHTLRTWRRQKRGPKFIKSGRLVPYRLSAVEEFISAGSASATA